MANLARLVKLNTEMGLAYLAVMNVSFILDADDHIKIGMTCGQVFTTTKYTLDDVISILFGSFTNVELEKAPIL